MTTIRHARHFGNHARGCSLIALSFAVLIGPPALAQVPGAATNALNAFENQVQDYARLHRRLEQQIGPIELTTPIAEINRRIVALAAAIRAERGDVRQGDFFTPVLTHLLRARVNDALLMQDFTADDVRHAGRVDGIDYGRITLRVNDTFPWVLAVGMFPCVIDALPPLPPELQYRIVGDDLLLIDIHASLIVDILPGVLTDLTMQFRSPPRE